MMKRKYAIEFEMTVKQTSPLAEAAFMPVRLNGVDAFKRGSDLSLDLTSLYLVRLDKKGDFCVFDPDAKGEKRYAVPARFDTDNEGAALCVKPRRGDLVFVAPFLPEKQSYRLYFNAISKGKENHAAPFLIGDGDSFIQEEGILQTDSVAIPFSYGNSMFGQNGLCISSGTTGKNYFFRTSGRGADKHFISCGEIKDCNGHTVSGIATFHDQGKRGISDIIAGCASDGRIYFYKNTGSNESPVFAGPEALTLEDGTPMTVIPFLTDIVDKVYREDGSVNPIYPKMKALRVHGGAIHVYTVPRWFSFKDCKKEGLLVGVQDRTLFFEKTPKGFKAGKWILDKKGKPLMTGRMICPADLNNDGQMELIGGDHIWKIRFFRYAAFHKGSPVFEEFSSWKPEPPIYRMTPFYSPEMPGKILCGTFSGNILQMDFRFKKEKPFIGKSRFLTMKHAPFGHYMAPLEYVDMNEDGVKDIISGDINGGLYFARNTGTNRNPFFATDVQLEDSDGPIKIHGGPDPVCGSDGYSKPTAAKLTSSGRMDLLAGSGFGKIFFYRNKGVNKNGIPVFVKGEILKDSKGKEIGCHHMSSVAYGNLFGQEEGHDLVVGGSGPIHGHPDADTDTDTWLRHYQGKSDKNGRIVFAPYNALRCNDDKLFCYRPRPAFHHVNGKNTLLLNSLIYHPDKKSLENFIFGGTYPCPLLRGIEKFIPSDIRFALLTENDPIVTYGTCQAISYVFREAFILNGGYMNAAAVFKKSDMVISSGKKRIAQIKSVIQKKIYNIPYSKDTGLLNIPQNALCFSNFRTLSRIPDLPVESNADRKDKIKFYLVHGKKELCIRLVCPEPETERLLNIGKNNNSFANQSDDALFIKINKSSSGVLEYVFHITSRGLLTEYTVDR